MPRISKAVARVLIQWYKNTGGWDNGQTRSVWFSKDDFIQILSMTDEFDADGMHIYLAKYPDEEMPEAPDPEEYRNRITVVFVPTRDKQDIFDVEAPPDQAMMATNGDADDPAFDHGELEP
ncbi:MAG TPA: hypothetical protein VGQ09_10805 [Chitinophagaceae bacterium]|nr:hypothetical protein [Chitinophagaceae bacterium]